MIFLAGPPGVGKSSLGSRACENLGISFVDAETEDMLTDAIENSAADVVAISWDLQQDKKILKRARMAGTLLLLWDHPQNLVARSNQSVVFTPSRRLKTRGGFGRRGTACLEFRRLDRACDGVVDLTDLSVDDAAKELEAWLAEAKEADSDKGVDLSHWAESWCRDVSANKKAARLLADAMGEFVAHLRRDGASPRALSSLMSDLDAAGLLVFMYDAPSGSRVLRCFSCAPWTYEFSRKFSDSPNLVARYERNLGRFARYLEGAGRI